MVNAHLFFLFAIEQGLDKDAQIESAAEEFDQIVALANDAMVKILEDVVVSEEEIRQFYDDNATQLSNISYDTAKSLIEEYLVNEKRRGKYYETLIELTNRHRIVMFSADGNEVATVYN